MQRIDIQGQRFGRLVVLSEAGRKGRKVAWLCQCDCGKTTRTTGTLLRTGQSKSCGCTHGGHNATHRMTGSRLYGTWKNMLNRTTNPNTKGYTYYGGRGITVCERWRKFENFYADMGPTFRDGLSLDRIDSNGNYEPANCRWVDLPEQNRNKRSNVHLTLHGHTLIMSAWAEKLGIPYSRLAYRVSKGWPHERALTEGVAPERVAATLEELEQKTDER
ncbi:AP2 domain-containing protein [Streptomyces anthocyanicus]|uniref:AP2 domain-containing protein n=1 Tax=Streptomyces anthocyanicus TaxID=68174 RepID=UPI003429CEA2